jgi:hypothetical protein
MSPNNYSIYYELISYQPAIDDDVRVMVPRSTVDNTQWFAVPISVVEPNGSDTVLNSASRFFWAKSISLTQFTHYTHHTHTITHAHTVRKVNPTTCIKSRRWTHMSLSAGLMRKKSCVKPASSDARTRAVGAPLSRATTKLPVRSHF